MMSPFLSVISGFQPLTVIACSIKAESGCSWMCGGRVSVDCRGGRWWGHGLRNTDASSRNMSLIS